MIKMSECNIPETYVKTEVGQTFRWETSEIANEGDQLLAKGQGMGLIAAKLQNANNSQQIIYYGISIPSDANVNGSEDLLHVYTDKTEALKIVKKFKKARFKAFKSRQEAVEFAVHGSDILTVTSPGMGENSETSSPLLGEKPSPFKGPKPQDLVRLRRLIERGDSVKFSSTVWENPRYLVSSGDTPAILQEGCRYNALHVAAMAKNAEICDLVLRTVGDVTFIQLLYGEDDVPSCQERARILVDLYLNTPCKGMNETPLHFAVKFGAVSVVETLLSYPQCDKYVRNKLGSTPKDVICGRVSKPSKELVRELEALLDDRFYVPVLRSEDNSMQPTVGEPFSPACPLVLKANPINPRMEIRAYAGPMGREEATTFRKKWKTPPRILRTPIRNVEMQQYTGSPIAHDVRLQDTEKGLERVGRDLAKQFRVGWNEYWPFLDTFTNLASWDGLQKLESYLRRRYHDAVVKPVREDKPTVIPSYCSTVQSSGDGAISPISDLCLAFRACSLSDNNLNKLTIRNKPKVTQTSCNRCSGDLNVPVEEENLHTIPNPGHSPFLYVEKSCQVFAKRISDFLSIIGRSSRFGETVFNVLKLEVRRLQDLICSFKEDTRFVSVDFNLLHSRIAMIVGYKLCELESEEMELVASGLKCIVSASRGLETFSDDEDSLNASYRSKQMVAEQQKKSESERGQVKCLAEHILNALEKHEDGPERVKTEDECIKVWGNAVECVCLRQNFARNTRKGSSLKRSRYVPPKGMDGVTRRLAFDIDGSSDKTDKESAEKVSDDEDDDFYTPPSSPEVARCESDDDGDMATPDEGVDVYIEGDAPSKLDVAVMQAIEGANISVLEFPNIYRWRHSVLLHSDQERAAWSSPSSRPKDQCRSLDRTRCVQVSTPPQAWHKITGPYSPMSPQR